MPIEHTVRMCPASLCCQLPKAGALLPKAVRPSSREQREEDFLQQLLSTEPVNRLKWVALTEPANHECGI
jgi:hypothetical protein